MLKNSTVQLMALGLVGSFAASAAAQDSGALIDVLVRKGVLKDQEAEQIRAQLSRDYAANTPAGKLNLSSSVKELKLSGDVRLRDVYDSQQKQAAGGDTNAQRNRYRLRLRVNADYKLNDDWFAGFGLQTGANNDSANQTMGDGQYYQNYNIFINKAFIGWTPVDGVTLVGGKQTNPFYTTDLVWDNDINPTGFTQRVDLHKVFGFSGLELSLVAGQFVVSDNGENNNASGAATATSGPGSNRDAFVYQTQLIAAVELLEGYKLTVAPGFYCTNGARLQGNGGGQANPAIGPANGARGLDGLKMVLLPGDVSFKVAGKPVKALWDFSYNTDATDRTAYLNLVNGRAVKSSASDNVAYLAGVQVGENKKKGDWSVMANYRRVGLSAVDWNINDSDWAESLTNMSGYKAGFLYNLGDATTIGATYFVGDNLRKDVNSSPGSPMNSVQVLQLDLNIKF